MTSYKTLTPLCECCISLELALHVCDTTLMSYVIVPYHFQCAMYCYDKRVNNTVRNRNVKSFPWLLPPQHFLITLN